MTINELYVRCWTEHWNKPRFRKSRHADVVDGYYRRRIKEEFGNTPVDQVTIGAVRWWHAQMEDKPYEANRSLEVLSRLFSFAEEREIIPQGTNPCRVVKAFKERQRERYATPEEVKAITVELDRERASRPYEVAFVYLLMFTGARPISLLRAKRKDVSPAGILVFDGKSTAATGQKEVIIFPEPAMEIIRRLPPRKDGLLVLDRSPKEFWDRIRTRAGCPDLDLRDWRRTLATYALSSGIGLGTIGHVLNHSSTQTTWRYARLLPAARQEAVNKTAAEILRMKEQDSDPTHTR